MRRSPEALIARLRNRRSRITIYSVSLTVSSALLAASVYLLIEMVSFLAPKEGEGLALSQVAREYSLVGVAVLQVMSLMLILGASLFFAMLVAEIATFTKNDLLLDLSDRVQALERSQSANPEPPTPSP
jgi:hypothetical protein